MKIKVENFQSIKSAEIEVKGLTVIAGENSIGKSALARAFAGVFSNLRGNAHVRMGENHSSVLISFEDGNEVLWEKGKKVNRYVVNGKEIAKVGASVPDEVRALGVTSVEIDGKDFFPQIAKQFQTIFLIDQPPSALSSALSDVEVIQQLEKSSANARSEIRDIKSRLKVKREDLEKAQSNLTNFEGFDYGVILKHEQAEAEKNQAESRLRETQALIQRRSRLMRAKHLLSPVEGLRIPRLETKIFEELDKLKELKRRRNKLSVASMMIEVGLEKYEMPPLPTLPDVSELERLAHRKQRLAKAVEALSDIENVVSADTSLLEDYRSKKELAETLTKKSKLMWGIVLAEKEIRNLTREAEMVQKEIQQKVCPVCLRGGELCHV
jgi:DNA repair ATPase RecN